MQSAWMNTPPSPLLPLLPSTLVNASPLPSPAACFSDRSVIETIRKIGRKKKTKRKTENRTK